MKRYFLLKSLLSVLALAFGALTFQSCEIYPNGTSRGYYGGGYYAGGGDYDGRYYDGGGYGPTVVVSSGDREHHDYGYSNEYYDRENNHANRNVNVNRNAQIKRNAHANRNVQANRNVRVNRNAHVNRNENAGHQ